MRERVRDDLDDENDGGGLAYIEGGPTTRRQLLAQLDALGIEPHRDFGFGSRPFPPHYPTVPPKHSGAPIVDAARALRDRKEGLVPLSNSAILDEGTLSHDRSDWV